MQTTFKLRKGKKKNTILLDFRHGRNIRVRYSTSQDFNLGSEKYWDSKKGRIKSPNDIKNFQFINQQLREIENEIERDIASLERQNKLSQLSCQSAIKQILKIEQQNPEEEKHKSGLVLDYFNWYLEYYKTNNSSYSNKPLTLGTLKTYKNSRNYLVRFLKKNNIKNFCFEDIDESFYNKFIQFGYEKGYSRNYIGTTIQKLKTIIGHAYENKIHHNNEFKRRYFAKLREEVNHPYLNEQELLAISKVKTSSKIENDVKDIFLIAAYTGLRIGDLITFLKSPKLSTNEGKKFIHLKQSKTGGEVYIPINSKILEILKRRNGSFPPAIHQNYINKYIKSIANKAEIKQEFVVERTISGKKIKDSQPKYKFISAHTARRSFCTNAYNAGLPPHQIMVISGHKSEKVFYNYIKASIKTKAIQIAEHSFFD
jgi:integrase